MAKGIKTGGGSRKGIPNKANAEITAMVDTALSDVGGVEYLKAQAIANPVAFLGLVGKRLPRVVSGPNEDGSHSFTVSWRQPT